MTICADESGEKSWFGKEGILSPKLKNRQLIKLRGTKTNAHHCFEVNGLYTYLIQSKRGTSVSSVHFVTGVWRYLKFDGLDRIESHAFLVPYYKTKRLSWWDLRAEGDNTMLYRITVKNSKLTSGIRVEKGMSVDVVTNSMSNPVTTNGGQAVVDAFMRIYGIDIKKAGALSMAYLDVERIG